MLIQADVTTKQYTITNDYGAMTISINESTGLFMAYGDYGKFSHYWTAPGPDGLISFLAHLSYDYAMAKLTPTFGEQFDVDRTIVQIAKRIKKNNLPNKLEAIDALRDLREYTTEERFFDALFRTKEVVDALGDDTYSLPSVKVKDRGCITFWNDFFIPFVSSLRPDNTLKIVNCLSNEYEYECY